MSINFSKSSCLRIGPRNDVVCATITSLTGHSIPWTSEIRYLGVYRVKFRTAKCSLDAAKRGFYRASNSFFLKNRAYCIGGSDSPTGVHKMYTDLIIRP